MDDPILTDAEINQLGEAAYGRGPLMATLKFIAEATPEQRAALGEILARAEMRRSPFLAAIEDDETEIRLRPDRRFPHARVEPYRDRWQVVFRYANNGMEEIDLKTFLTADEAQAYARAVLPKD